MDSNVSKNTNSHNFFKLRVERQKLEISVRNLLKKELILALTLYQHKFNVEIEQNLLKAIINNKITILDQKNSFQSSENLIADSSTGKYLMSIGYRCPLGLCLTTILQQPASIIVEQLGEILISSRKYRDLDLEFEISTEICVSGWINFYLDAKFIAGWLKNSLCLSQTEILGDRSLELERSEPSTQDKLGLFPAQYVYARCCSLLSLGEREKIISTSDRQGCIQIQDAESIAWLDKRGNLWLTEPAEYNLLRQLLLVMDAYIHSSSTDRWSKLILDLSQATECFLTDCRFLGEVKAQYPQRAIARLGLIALVQFWLQRILRKKLGVVASRSI